MTVASCLESGFCRWQLQLALFSLLFCLFGCTRIPFALPETAPVQSDMTAARLASNAWPAQVGVYRLRQTVLFEFRGARVPMAGVMRLDLSARMARLVAMNDMGVKFFDLTITEKDEEQHYLLPKLSQFPHFTEAVAASVRRVFLAPRPEQSDALVLTKDHYLLQRHYKGGTVCFDFCGRQPQLIETKVSTEQERWQAQYFEYQTAGKISYPRGIILEDNIAGYRLTLWLDEVEKLDE